MTSRTSPKVKPTKRRSPETKRSPKVDMRFLERSDTVLWSLAPGGIVLHNYARRCFLELDQLGYRLWGLLDGARPVEEVVRSPQVAQSGGKNGTSESAAREIVATLVAHGFVEERSS